MVKYVKLVMFRHTAHRTSDPNGIYELHDSKEEEEVVVVAAAAEKKTD